MKVIKFSLYEILQHFLSIVFSFQSHEKNINLKDLTN